MLPGSRDGGKTKFVTWGHSKRWQGLGLLVIATQDFGFCTLGESPNHPQETTGLPAGLKSPAEGHLCDPHPSPISTDELPAYTGGAEGL